MSTKPSPSKKDEKITSSPSKKDEKTSPSSSSSSAIMTRHQSAFLNTRQLRNKDSTHKKISEITQLLLSPMKDKTKTSQVKKRSPRDKKVKAKASPKKQETVSVTKLVLEAKKEKAGKKRKNVAEPKGIKPTKVVRKEPQSLSMQELIDLCEEQSLDDEDFLEILTCESPVWWEQPDHQMYCEEAIFTTPEEKRYFQQFFKSQMKAEEERAHVVLETSNINIPEVKQNDDRFMKKRSKLENLLGNIKNKLTDANNEGKQITQIKIEKKTSKLEEIQDEKTEGKDRSKWKEEVIVKQEIKKERRDNTPSEGTSSSDEMFFGFQNEDILKDLENMNIPTKEEEHSDNDDPNSMETEDNIAQENITEVKSECNDETNNVEPKNDTKIEGTDSEHSSANDSQTTENMVSKTKNATTVSEVNATDESNKKSLKDTVVDIAKNTFDDKPKTSNKGILNPLKESRTPCRDTDRVTVNLACNSNTYKPNKPFDSVKIYYIDASSKTNESGKNSKKDENNKNKIANNEILKSKESELDYYNKTLDESKRDKNIENDALKDINGKNQGNSDKNQLLNNDSITKDEIESKSSTSKNLNKNQLMAVYKIITDEEYRENYMKTIKDKVEKMDTTTDGLETLFKTCKTSLSSCDRTTSETNIDDENHVNVKEQENEKSNEVEAQKEKSSNEISQTRNSAHTNKDAIANINNNASQENVSDKIVPTKNEQSNIEICTNTKIDIKDNKIDKLCSNCDDNTERSLNITSKVKSAKYCLKCSSIFESETCSYCAKKSKINQENIQNAFQQQRKGNS